MDNGLEETVEVFRSRISNAFDAAFDAEHPFLPPATKILLLVNVIAMSDLASERLATYVLPGNGLTVVGG